MTGDLDLFKSLNTPIFERTWTKKLKLSDATYRITITPSSLVALGTLIGIIAMVVWIQNDDAPISEIAKEAGPLIATGGSGKNVFNLLRLIF